MDSDFAGGKSPRKKPKIINPIDQPNQLSVHELAANEGHDISSAAGPEAGVATAFVGDYSRGYAGVTDNNQSSHDANAGSSNSTSRHSDKIHSNLKDKLSWFSTKLTNKQRVIALIVGVFVVIGSGAAAFTLNGANEVKPIQMNASVVPEKKVYYSPLSGVEVSQKQSKLPVTGVMIENSLPARPQSGLSQAGVIYEAIAEGGITRFLALFQANKPGNVGPIRSARPYFVRWNMSYDANYAHVGGSGEALRDIQRWKVKDLDQSHAEAYYHRVKNRWAPHNMYTSMTKLHKLEARRGWNKPSKFTGFSRKDDQPAKTPSAKSIFFNISEPSFNVRYTYDAKADTYKRFMAGEPHLDANTKKQLKPKVVVALIIPYGHEADNYHSYYSNVGSGDAYVFQDGKMIKCKWEKTSNSAPVKLIDAKNQDIKLNRGQTWLTALSSNNQLSYKP